MNVGNPLRTIAPVLDADVLLVLARTQASLGVPAVAAQVSGGNAQVRAVLERLADEGLVQADEQGGAAAYRLDRSHVLADVVLAAVTARTKVEDELRRVVASWVLQPVAVVVHGAFARADGDAASALELLLVRPDGADPDLWQAQCDELVRLSESLTGNVTTVVELSGAELGDAVVGGRPPLPAIRRDGIVLVGPTLRRLLDIPAPREVARSS